MSLKGSKTLSVGNGSADSMLIKDLAITNGLLHHDMKLKSLGNVGLVSLLSEMNQKIDSLTKSHDDMKQKLDSIETEDS